MNTKINNWFIHYSGIYQNGFFSDLNDLLDSEYDLNYEKFCDYYNGSGIGNGCGDRYGSENDKHTDY